MAARKRFIDKNIAIKRLSRKGKNTLIDMAHTVVLNDKRRI